MHPLSRSTALALVLPAAACTTMADLPAERIASATLSLAGGVPAGTV
jgi:superoxide dismutase, Cu-Zn family